MYNRVVNGTWTVTVTYQVLKTQGFTADSFQLYPNPTKDIVTVSAKETITGVALYNMLGQQVLAQDGRESGKAPFAELLAASRRSRVRLFAENSPFEMKDHLKARGYRWSDGSDGRLKSWWIEVADDALEDELRYLRTEVYRWPEADPPIRRLTAFERFKA